MLAGHASHGNKSAFREKIEIIKRRHLMFPKNGIYGGLFRFENWTEMNFQEACRPV